MTIYSAIAVAAKKGYEGQEVIDFCESLGFERVIAVAAHREILKAAK